MILRQGVPVAWYYSSQNHQNGSSIKARTRFENLKHSHILKQFLIKVHNPCDSPILATSYTYRKNADANKIALCLGYHPDVGFYDYMVAVSARRFEQERPNILQAFVQPSQE